MDELAELRNAWRRFVAAKLEVHSASLVAVLRELVRQPYPAEVTALDFELFPDNFTQGFPARVFFMGNDNSEVFVQVNGKARYPSAVAPGLLAIEHIYSYDEEEAFLARDESGALENEIWDLASESFFEWFESCWRKSGGEQFSLRATIMPHDHYALMRVLPTGSECG